MLRKPYSYYQTITQLFEQQVARYPENVALYLDNIQISYKQFNEDSNRCAHYLREQGLKPNQIVAIEMTRSYEMLCAIFAIIKAGGTYLPLSPDYPEQRKKQILEDAENQFLIVDVDYPQESNPSYQILKLPDARLKSYSTENLSSLSKPEDTAYVIYTSGSTGTPKGVMIAHHSLINRIEWMQSCFPIDAKDVLFQKTHCGFDVSIWELFWWSITGAGLTLLPHGHENNIILMTKTIREKKVSVIHFVPPVLNVFLDYIELGDRALKLDSLRFIFSSGEALPLNTVNHFKRLFPKPYPQLINLYGPTEATIDVSYFICDKTTNYQEIPIGKPIDNVEFEVLDENFEPQKTGQVGELYISGVCLAKGYLNNQKQTEQSFLVLANKLVYKTGDLVRWNSSGELCYIGRKDQQVKINGIRIELGEIEYHINAFNQIAQAVVLYLSLPNSLKKLVAFIKLKAQTLSLDLPLLKSSLQAQLPEYMIPHDFFILDDYPLKVNGKLDRKKLVELYELEILE